MLIDFTSNGSTNSISIQTVGSNLSVQTIDTIITGNTSIWNYNYSVPLINHIGGINDIKEIRFVPANSNSIIAIDNIRFNVSYDYNICITSTNTGSFTATLDFELPSIQTSIASSGAGLRYVTNEYEHYGVTFTNGVIHQNSADGAVGVLNSISPYRKARGGPKFIRPITGQIYYINLDIINYEFLNIVIDYAYNNNTFTISGVEADLTETLLVSATSGGFTWKYDFTIPSFQPNFTKLKFGGFPTSISAIDNIRITARPR